jgi:hypothetical protein
MDSADFSWFSVKGMLKLMIMVVKGWSKGCLGLEKYYSGELFLDSAVSGANQIA